MRTHALILTTTLVIGLVWPIDASSHGGGLDSFGCHRGPMAGKHFGSKSEVLRALRGGSQSRPTPRRQSTPTSSKIITGLPVVTDGDTIKIKGTRIRLHGIDAPENRQSCKDGAGKPYRCGQKATQALLDKINKRSVSCNRKDTDRYGRMVSVCWLDAESLNAWMVYDGWAVAYRRYSRDYVLHENAAKESKRGIWIGRFVKPESWRRTKRRK